MRVYDFEEHARWEHFEGKGWQIKDTLPELAIEVWTYFSGWGSRKNEDPPKFVTHVSCSIKGIYLSLTWEEAKDMHQRVVEELARGIAE